jgi:glycine hydroxymethyltransferase
MKQVADFLHRAVQLSLQLQKEAGTKMLKDFVRVATVGDGPGVKAVRELCRDVRGFARKWPLPGADIATIQRPVGVEEDD